MDRPNVLILCADMASAKHFGCYGDPVGATPRIDALVARGTRFEHAYCPCPPCIPARVSMMCGQCARTHGKMAHLRMPLQPRPALLLQLLSQHGYRTGPVGKTHWWPPTDTLGCDVACITIDNHLAPELGGDDAYVRFLRVRGLFDYHEATWQADRHRLHPDDLPSDCLKANWTGDAACALLEELAGSDEPFLLFCSFVEPYGPGSVRREEWERFRDAPLRPIIGRTGEYDNKPAIQRQAVARWLAQWDAVDVDRHRRGVYA